MASGQVAYETGAFVFVLLKTGSQSLNTTILLTEYDVCTASYGPSFFLPWKQGRKKRGSITCRTDRANEANKMFIIWLW